MCIDEELSVTAQTTVFSSRSIFQAKKSVHSAESPPKAVQPFMTVISPNSTRLVTSRLDTTRHVRHVEHVDKLRAA